MERSEGSDWESSTDGHLHRQEHKAEPEHAEELKQIRHPGQLAQLLQQDSIRDYGGAVDTSDYTAGVFGECRRQLHPVLQIVSAAVLHHPHFDASQPRFRQTGLQVPDRPGRPNDRFAVPQQQYPRGTRQNWLHSQ